MDITPGAHVRDPLIHILTSIDKHQHTETYDEAEKKVDGCGLITGAPWSMLAKPQVDTLSFAEFMKQLPRLERQNPQCVRQSKDRTQSEGMGIRLFPICPRVGGEYNIEPRNAHHLTLGSQIHVDEEAATESELAKLAGKHRVEDIAPLEVIPIEEPCEVPPCTPPQPAHASRVHARSGNALYVYFSNAILDAMPLCDLLNDSIVVVEENSADLIVELEDMNAVFLTNLEAVTRHGFKKLPHVVPANPVAVSKILLAASRWKSHLYGCSPVSWIKDVHLDFVHLERDGSKVDDMGYIVLKRKEAKSLDIGDVVDIDVHPDFNEFYGIEIRNGTEQELYVYLFTFDISDLSIASRWICDALQDPPLPAGGSLTIGYGAGGGLPLCYELPEGIDVDVGFLKVYLSTKPIDLECLEQESPFSTFRGFSTSSELLKLDAEDQWGTSTCTVVQHAHP